MEGQVARPAQKMGRLGDDSRRSDFRLHLIAPGLLLRIPRQVLETSGTTAIVLTMDSELPSPGHPELFKDKDLAKATRQHVEPRPRHTKPGVVAHHQHLGHGTTLTSPCRTGPNRAQLRNDSAGPRVAPPNAGSVAPGRRVPATGVGGPRHAVLGQRPRRAGSPAFVEVAQGQRLGSSACKATLTSLRSSKRPRVHVEAEGSI